MSLQTDNWLPSEPFDRDDYEYNSQAKNVISWAAAGDLRGWWLDDKTTLHLMYHAANAS